MQSTQALNAQLAKYDAITSSVEMNKYGYWVVAYSVAPGLVLHITICQVGITRDQAAELGGVALSVQTGQKVKQ